MDVPLELRPTLVIGLGGTGHEVVVRLKALLIGTFGEEIFEVIKLRVLDTADEDVVASSASGEPIRLDRDSELINIGHVPVDLIVRNIDKWPAIKNWLPMDLPVRAISSGAKQIRALGRLALFYHLNQDGRVRDQLLAAIRSLGNIHLRDRFDQLWPGRGINVFIVSSLCGGTGSGIFIDVAYLVQELLVDSGIPVEYCFVNGILALPEVFAMTASDAVMANAYAALRELNYFMQEGHYSTEYPDGLKVNIDTRPFNVCYLVDAVNEHGKRLSGPQEWASMIAESLFLQIATHVGRASYSVLDNIKSLNYEVTGPDGQVWPTAFSGLGVSGLVFLAQSVHHACALRFGEELTERCLLAFHNEQTAIQLSRAFADEYRLSYPPLMATLASRPDGTKLEVKRDLPLPDGRREEFLYELDRMASKIEAQLIHGKFRMVVEQNAASLADVLSEAVAQQTRGLVNDPQHGLRCAYDFLARLSAHVEELRGTFVEELATAPGLRSSIEKDQAQSRVALLDSLNSFRIGRGRRTQRALDAYLRAQETAWISGLKVQLLDAATEVLDHLSKALSAHLDRLSSLISKLEKVREWFQFEVAKLAILQKETSVATDITRGDPFMYYDKYKPVKGEASIAFISQFDVYGWEDRSVNDIGHEILSVACQPFEPILNERIENLIEAREGLAPSTEWLEALREASIPYWSYDPTQVDPSSVDLESVRVIGVEDRKQSVLASHMRRGEILVSTGDPHKIVVLHTKHGLPLFALAGIPVWETKYLNHLARDVSPLHIFPSLPWLQTESKTHWFALAQVFGLIQKIGVWYYYRPQDSGLDSIRLGQGVRAALREFLGSKKLMDDGVNEIERQIKKLGAEEAAKQIYWYARRPVPRGSEGDVERELKEAARSFVAQMGFSAEDMIALLATVDQLRLLTTKAQEFFEKAGFAASGTDEMGSFVCQPTTLFWKRKIKGDVYAMACLGEPVTGDRILLVREAIKAMPDRFRQVFILVDHVVSDEAWLQIAAFRAAGFDVIPIPLDLIRSGGAISGSVAEATALAKHLNRFLAQEYDPYDVRDPVSDVLSFFGREALSRELIDRLLERQPIGLFGLRKIGKSSLLRYTQSLMPCPTAWLDLQAGAEPIAIYDRILASWSADARERLDVSFDVQVEDTASSDPASDFFRTVQKALDRLGTTDTQPGLAIFLDEIELIVPPTDAAGPVLENYLSLMRVLRGLVQEDGRVVLMIAGVDPAINRTSRLGIEQKQNPFFQLLREVYVPPLLKSDCVQMIRNIGRQVELVYTDDAVEYVAGASGGHPFLARQLCSLAYRQREMQAGTVSLDDINEAYKQFQVDPRYAAFLGDTGLWNEVTSPRLWTNEAARSNQAVLMILARAAEPLPAAVITNQGPSVPLRTAVHALQQLYVIDSVQDMADQSGPYYAISFGLFHSWIRRVKLGLDE